MTGSFVLVGIERGPTVTGLDDLEYRTYVLVSVRVALWGSVEGKLCASLYLRQLVSQQKKLSFHNGGTWKTFLNKKIKFLYFKLLQSNEEMLPKFVLLVPIGHNVQNDWLSIGLKVSWGQEIQADCEIDPV